MVTYQCNVACRHCGPLCGTEEKDWIALDELKNLCYQAGELGAFNAVFTGGEPTLLKEKLIDLLKFIKSDTKLKGTRMVTNGKWATTYDIAKKKLQQWQDAGLDEINISCGEFHQEWIPIEFVRNAYKAACDLNFDTVALAGEFLNEASGKISPQMFEEVIGEKLSTLANRSPFSRKFHGLMCGAVMPYGRGKKYIKPEETVLMDESGFGTLCADVNSVITAHPNGNVTACCGVMVREDSLLTIGNWRRNSLKEILEESNEDIILNWIKHLGLSDMKKWLKDKDPSINFKEKYSSICDLCADIMYNNKCQELLLEGAVEREDKIIVNKIAHDATVYSDKFRVVGQK